MKCDVVEGVIGTPVGPYEVGACPRGVHRLGLEDRVTNENFLSLGTKEVRLQKNLLAPCQLECLRPILDWLTVFFSSQGDKVFPDVEPCDDVVDARSPEFKHKVLTTLKNEVKFGETITYGQLGVKSGFRVGSARAVGTVMATNPVPLLVPCHRVIKSSGEFGNYAKSSKNDIKVWLLNHESSMSRR